MRRRTMTESVPLQRRQKKLQEQQKEREDLEKLLSVRLSLKITFLIVSRVN